MDEKEIHLKSDQNRWATILFLVVFYQSWLYVGIGICFYAVYTFNWQLMIFLLTLSLLQNLIPRSNAFISFTKKHLKPLQYFKSFTRIYEEKIIDSKKCMFGLHPHAVLSVSQSANMNLDDGTFSNMTGLGSRGILLVPFAGAILRLWGIEGVDPQNLNRLMKAGKTVGLIPGGFEEATITSEKQIRIYVKERKGFIKYALRYDYTIYPVLNFNEHRAFKTFDHWTKARLFLNKLKIPSVVFWGGFLQIFFPIDVDFVTIVGKGIKRRKENIGKEPTQEEIDETHENYIKQLKRIHQKHRQKGGNVDIVFY